MPKNKNNENVMKESTTKIILNVPNDLAKTFKDLAIRRGIPRSSMIIYAMSWYLDYHTSLDLMPKMIDAIKYAENNVKNKTEDI